MIHHGSGEGFVGPVNFGIPEFKDLWITSWHFFGFLSGSPKIWAPIHDYAEFYDGIFLALGFLTRPAALTIFLGVFGLLVKHRVGFSFLEALFA